MSISKRVFKLAGWRTAKPVSAGTQITSFAFYGQWNGACNWMAAAEVELMAMSRGKSAGEGPLAQWMDEGFRTEHPDLFEFLAETLWDDGKKRLTGTLIFATEGRSLKCKVCDRDGKRGAWVTADTFAEILLRIDTLLHNDDLDWRKETR
jgi:hypothetical protein